MNTKEITVADIIKFFQSVPPETKIRVKEEVTRNWDTYTKYSNVIQHGDGEFDIECFHVVILLSLEFGRPLLILACLAGTSRNGRYALVLDVCFA